MIIVDTSVAFKWFSPLESDRELALQILDNHLVKKTSILIPDLFFYEMTNAWATKVNLPFAKIQEYLTKLQAFNLSIAEVAFSLLELTANFSKKYHVSVYDASYAVLAEEKGCDLITADKKFVKQVNLPYVKLLG